MVLIFGEAFYESVYDSGKKSLSGIFEFLHRAIMILAIMAWMIDITFPWKVDLEFWRLLVGFLLIRYAIFSIIYNLFRSDVQLDIFYVGRSKYFDRFIRLLLQKSNFNPSIFLGLTKLMSLIIGADIIEVKFISVWVSLISIGLVVIYTIAGIIIGIFKKNKK